MSFVVWVVHSTGPRKYNWAWSCWNWITLIVLATDHAKCLPCLDNIAGIVCCAICLTIGLQAEKKTHLLPCLAFRSLEDVNIQRMQELLHTQLLTYLTQQQQGGHIYRNDTKVNPCDNLCQSYF